MVGRSAITPTRRVYFKRPRKRRGTPRICPFRAISTSPLAAMSTSAEVEQDSQGNMAVGGATSSMIGYSVDGISTANIFSSAAGTNPRG
jgi:hypothetical protein